RLRRRTRPDLPHRPLGRGARHPGAAYLIPARGRDGTFLALKGASIMQEASASPLAAWESFYVMLGSAAAVLTGLVFVVITLLPDVRPQQSNESLETGVAVFSTSTIVHFCAVLLVCAILIAPWQELSKAALLLGLAGLAGMAYTLLTIRRLRRRKVESY